MGGIPTDNDARVVIDPQWTPKPGFYAAGEVACVSVHGANRLGTNSLVDLIVFGRRAGKHMAQFITENDHAPLPPEPEAFARELVDRLYTSTGGASAASIRSTLQNEMDDKVFVERSDQSLRHALDSLDSLQETYKRVQMQDKGKTFNTELVEAIEAFEADAEIHAIVLTGAGERAFSAGGDMTEVRERLGPNPTRTRSGPNLSEAVRSCRKPVCRQPSSTRARCGSSPRAWGGWKRPIASMPA